MRELRSHVRTGVTGALIAIFCGLVAAQERLEPIQVGEVTVERAVLSCGLRVLAVHDAEAETVDVGIAYAAGTRHEAAETSGLAHLTEHCMFAGTQRLADGEYDERIKAAGGESNAYTRADYTFYYDHGLPPESLQIALDLEADRMVNLSFPEEGFTREWKSLLDEERRTHSDAGRRMGHLRELAFSDHPYGIGIKKGDVHTQAQHLTREEAQGFYMDYYRPDRAVLVISGAIDPDAAIALAEAEFADVPDRSAEAWTNEPAPAAALDGPRDAEVALGAHPTAYVAFRAPGLEDAEAHAAAQLVAGLLDRALGEAGGGAGLEERADPYLLVLSLADDDLTTPPANLEARILEIVEDVLGEAGSADALEAVRKKVRTRYLDRRVVDRPYFSLATDLAILEATTAEGAALAGRWHELVDSIDGAAVAAAARETLVPAARVSLRCTPVPQRKRAYLGVRSEDDEGGARVTEVVEDSAAERAGVVAGDLLVALEGEPIESLESLLAGLAARAADDIVLLEVEREGDGRIRLPVRLGARPEAGGGRTSSIDLYNEAKQAAGQGRVDDAVVAYDELFERSEDRIMRVIYMTELGGLLTGAGRFDEAIERFERGLAVVDYPATREMYEAALAAREESLAAQGPDDEAAPGAKPAPTAAPIAAPTAVPTSAGGAAGDMTVRFSPDPGGARLTVEVAADGAVAVTSRGVRRYEVITGAGAGGAAAGGAATPVAPAAPATPVTPPPARPASDRAVPVGGHDLDLQIDLDRDLISGVDRIGLADVAGGVLELSLPDADSMTCTDGEGAALVTEETPAGTVRVQVPESLTVVVVEYSVPLSAVGEVGKGLYLGGRPWYPRVAGDPLLTHRLRVRVPEGWRSVTQGARRIVDDRTTVWTARHPSDGLSLAAGPLEVVERQHGDVWLYGYFYADDLHLAAGYLDASARYLDLYNELLGPYPYRKFAVVENFLPTGYGMPSWTLLGETVVRLPFITETSLGHEMCHNWWGNGVFVDREQGNWCEGLTTYCADHLYEERKSAAAGAAYRKAILEKYAAYVPAGDEMPLSAFRGRTDDRTQATGYGRVAMLFHELRVLCGQHGIDFWAVLREVVVTHQFERRDWSIFSDAFAAAGLEAAGLDVAAWFRARIDSVEAPVLTVAGDQLTGTWPAGDQMPSVKVLYRGIEGDLYEHVTLSGNQGVIAGLRDDSAWRVVDPDFDLFRRLDPREVDPTIAQVKGDEAALAVFAENMERDEMIAYGKVAAALGIGDHRRWRTSGAIGPEETRGGPCVFFGLDSTTAGFEFLHAHEDVIDGESAGAARAGRAPDEPAKFWLQVLATKASVSEMLASKLPHYGKYSHVSFAPGGRVMTKAVIPTTVSPLQLRRQ